MKVIKIGPLSTARYAQALALVKSECESLSDAPDYDPGRLSLNSLSFWQHWFPIQMHVAPSVYIASEDNAVLGLIGVCKVNRSRECWEVSNLLVHPDHRGRGIAGELIKYVFAQFGSQGAQHFIAEVPASNSAALALFASCGFCRSAQITYYNLPEPEKLTFSPGTAGLFRLALPHYKNALFQLYRDIMPPDIRNTLSFMPEDFAVKEMIPFTSVESTRQKLMRSRIWYWVAEDTERNALTCAVKVTSQPQTGYKLEFALHPGWKQMATELVNFTLWKLVNDAPRLPIWTKVYDFQPEIQEALVELGLERCGESLFLTREHWVRSRMPRRSEVINPLAQPVINLPLATE